MSAIKNYREKFEKLQTRERALVLLVVLALVYLIWSLAIGAQIDAETKLLQRTQIDLDAKVASQKAELASLALRQQQDPDKLLRQEAVQLARDIEQLDQSLAAMSVGLVPAHELPLILESVLLKTGKLSLVGLQTLPIEELQLSTQQDQADTTPTTGVYRHTVKLTLQGGYFALNEYLQTLEALPWRFYWDSLDYKVSSYPQADIELKVYTLSTERGAVGG
ncbi:hypothetical protein QWY82_15425 [Simiduia curdlanivorans]|uniref:MSHA biogenesis protein MshJ n=1 Tax=Simiduia curdlanivorans TaxID=1492769 RepID=A0ABV8V259_9GAMM|nr:hypothetical protein [Simiduia curdlanivorans]MDN3640185.1 hypothetical protein [Simiduia curdlanivorans]